MCYCGVTNPQKAQSQGHYLFLAFSFVQFNVTSTEKSGLIQSCERKTNLPLAGISGDAARLVEFTNYINETGRIVWHIIFDSYAGWTYDDDNQTGVPETSQTLTSGTGDYLFPTGAIAISGIEVKDTSGIWSALSPITLEQIQDRSPESEFYKTNATPLFYRLVGDAIRLYPAPNWTQASSLKVYFNRGSVAFVSTDTTAAPGFASEYHDVLASGASLLWAKYKSSNPTLIKMLEDEYTTGLARIRDFYTRRLLSLFPPRIRVRDAFRDAQ